MVTYFWSCDTISTKRFKKLVFGTTSNANNNLYKNFKNILVCNK